MPQEQYRTPAKFWPVIAEAITAALTRIRRHQEHPDVASFPPIEPQEWREGEMLVTIAHGPDAVPDAERQLQAAVNLLALVVHEYHGGTLKIPRERLDVLTHGLKLTSANVDGVQVLTVTEAPRRRIVTA